MNTIVKKSMRDQIYDLIKNRILTHKYASGDAIKILTLSNELNVSNTPIREAVSMLCAEGLIESNQNLKFKVVELTESTIQELNYTIYILLNGAFTTYISAAHLSSLIEKLEEAYKKQMDMLEKNNGSYHQEYIWAAIEFDRCIVEITENHKLLSVFDNLSQLLYLAVQHDYENDNLSLEENNAEHRLMIDALKNEDRNKFSELLFLHYNKH